MAGEKDNNTNGHIQEERTQNPGEVPESRRRRNGQRLDCNTTSVLGTLLLGIPSAKRLYLNQVTFFINVLLVLGVKDVVYRARIFHPSHDLSFTRVGYVSDTAAKVLVREPDPAQLPLFVSYRVASGGDGSWKSAAQIYLLNNETDFTHSLTISSLRPSTLYQYAASNNKTGSFTTAAPAGQMHPGTSKFTFLTTSCIKPRFPYNPFSHPLSIPGLTYLSNLLPILNANFMLFLGDFIYIDVPHRHGFSAETYRREYRQVYSSPSWPPVSSLPWLHVIDDHEIANDWDQGLSPPYPSAIDPWNIYHSSINPPPAHDNATYSSFTQGPASFFMLDTRRHRTPSSSLPASSPDKTMLGPTQLTHLLAFLRRRENPGVHWKIIVSSIPFTKNWRLNALDTWAGYLHERRILLEAMWDLTSSGDGAGVIILSGDRHEFAATKFPPPKGGRWPESATIHEFSTSPLSMFYLPIRSYWEVSGQGAGLDEEGEDVCVEYIPDGNSKVGAVEMENIGEQQGLLRFKLFINGAQRWEYVLTTPPVVSGGRWGRGRDAIWS